MVQNYDCGVEVQLEDISQDYFAIEVNAVKTNTLDSLSEKEKDDYDDFISQKFVFYCYDELFAEFMKKKEQEFQNNAKSQKREKLLFIQNMRGGNQIQKLVETSTNLENAKFFNFIQLQSFGSVENFFEQAKVSDNYAQFINFNGYFLQNLESFSKDIEGWANIGSNRAYYASFLQQYEGIVQKLKKLNDPQSNFDEIVAEHVNFEKQYLDNFYNSPANKKQLYDSFMNDKINSLKLNATDRKKQKNEYNTLSDAIKVGIQKKLRYLLFQEIKNFEIDDGNAENFQQFSQQEGDEYAQQESFADQGSYTDQAIAQSPSGIQEEEAEEQEEVEEHRSVMEQTVNSGENTNQNDEGEEEYGAEEDEDENMRTVQSSSDYGMATSDRTEMSIFGETLNIQDCTIPLNDGTNTINQNQEN